VLARFHAKRARQRRLRDLLSVDCDRRAVLGRRRLDETDLLAKRIALPFSRRAAGLWRVGSLVQEALEAAQRLRVTAEAQVGFPQIEEDLRAGHQLVGAFEALPGAGEVVLFEQLEPLIEQRLRLGALGLRLGRGVAREHQQAGDHHDRAGGGPLTIAAADHRHRRVTGH